MTVAYLFGAAALALFWVFSVFATGDWAPWALAMTDSTVGTKKLSASKFQNLAWTLVTLFSYASVFGARLLATGVGSALNALPSVPGNLLLLMGLSTATAVGSKGVTISYKARGLIPQESGGLTSSPEGDADLVKTQMVVWSLVGALIYLLSVVHLINSQLFLQATAALPDVDGALLVLSGVSQGTYFGNKLVTRDVERKTHLYGILPLKGPPGTTITLTGEEFGAERGDNFVTLDGQVLRAKKDGLLAWSDSQVQVVIPKTHQAGDKVAVQLFRDGEWSEQREFEVA
jgi:hypothetical protein